MAYWLVALTQRWHRADIVDTHGTSSISDVVEDVVLSDPRLGAAPDNKVDAVRGRESQLSTRVCDDVLAFGHVDSLVSRVHPTASNWIFGGGFACHEVVPRVVRYVVCASGLVDV